jgi:ABC-type oligopeptide transport system substrate-binding subunit
MLAMVALAGLLAACQSRTTQRHTGPAPDAQQILRLPLLTSQPVTLDPAFVSDPASAQVVSLIYPSLMTLDAGMVAHPWAAESVTMGADSRTLTFTLRSGMRFSDGEAINAQTFAYSLNRALDPCLGAPDVAPLLMLAGAAAFHAQRCENLASDLTGPTPTLIGAGSAIQVVDPLTLTLRLERPWVGALTALAAPIAAAIPPTLAQSDGAQWTIHLTDQGDFGGSLFCLAASTGVTGGQTTPVTLRLTRNPDFWGTAARLSEIDFTVYVSQSAEWSDYQAGNLDLGYPPPTASASLVTQSKPLESLIYLGLNWNTKPLDHLELRQALALAIDKSSLAMNTLDGLAAPTNHLLPEGVPGYNPSLVGPDQTQAVTGNITKSVNLAHAFASSACGDQFAGCPELTLEVASEDSAGQALATAIAQMWQAVAPGYPLQTRLEPQKTLDARIASGAAQLYLATWQAEYADPSAWLDTAFGPGAALANASAATTDVQTLLAQGEAEQDPTQRAQDYQAAEQLLVSDVAWVPLAQRQVFWQTRPNVSGLTLDGWGAIAVYDTAPTVVIMRNSAVS